MITIILILCLAAGALVATRINLFNSLVNPNGNQDRDRSWKIAEKLIDGWDGSQWSPSEKNIYYYNPAHPAKVDSIATLNWDSMSETWSPGFMQVNTFLPDQEHISFSEYRLTMGEYNLPFVRMYGTYDAQYRLTHFRMSMYDMTNSAWADQARMHINYGTGTTFQVVQWQAPDDVSPEEFSRSNFTFDTQGRLTQETWQTSPDSSNWVNSTQLTRTYHPHDTTSGAQLIYNISHQMMSNSLNNNGVYFGMASEELEKNWAGTDWVNGRKSVYTYNTSDKVTEELILYWDSAAWGNSERYAYTYDTNGNMHQEIYQDVPSGTEWNNSSRSTYSWSQVTANEDDVVPVSGVLALSIYPNPFRDAMTIQGKSSSNAKISYDIFNLKGQIVRTLSSAGNADITWDGLDNSGKAPATGIYFMRATQGKSTATRKFIKMQ